MTDIIFVKVSYGGNYEWYMHYQLSYLLLPLLRYGLSPEQHRKNEQKCAKSFHVSGGSFVLGKKNPNQVGWVLSRIRESNPPPQLGKLIYYRCTNPAKSLLNNYLTISKL